ncbi:D-mannose binding lectin [compost metagenome]
MPVKYTNFQSSGSMLLPPNQTLSPGQFLRSENGRYYCRLRSDGNLVVEQDGKLIWVADARQHFSKTINRKKMREKTHFVVSNSGFLYDPSRGRLWIAESTHATDKSYWYNNCLVLRDDGNLVIYDQRSGDVRWARTGFVPGRIPKPKPYKELFNFPVYTWDF